MRQSLVKEYPNTQIVTMPAVIRSATKGLGRSRSLCMVYSPVIVSAAISSQTGE